MLTFLKDYTKTQETVFLWDVGIKSQEGDVLFHFVYCILFKHHKPVLFYGNI